MTSKTEIQQGLAAHARWKRRLRGAIQTQTSDFDPATVGLDGACEFGKWLDSLPLADRQTEEYKQVKTYHREFHKTASDILKLALAGKADEAVAELSQDGAYGKISGKLVMAMQRWEASL